MTIVTLPQSVNVQITLIYRDESLTLEQKHALIAEIVKLYEGFANASGANSRTAEAKQNTYQKG